MMFFDSAPHTPRIAPGRLLLPAMLLSAFLSASVAGQDYLRLTSFATIDIAPPQIRGSIWIDIDSFQAIHVLDQDGDNDFTADELNSGRTMMEGYLRSALDFLWDERLHFPNVIQLEVRTHERSGRRCFVADFNVLGLPPGRPVTIVSRILREIPRGPSLMALISHGGRRDLVVLGPGNYFVTDPPKVTVPEDSPFRPDAERGRIAVARDVALEMLYARPENAVHLYLLKPDQYHPHVIREKTIVARIKPSGEAEPRSVVLEARPLKADTAGLCSHYVASVPEWKDKSQFNVDLDLTQGGERLRVFFDFTSVDLLTPEQRLERDRRFGCPRMCLGVESRKRGARCVACGTELMEVRGAPVPGAGSMGRHGGVLVPFSDTTKRWEGFLAGPREWRLYLTNADLDVMPVGSVTGQVAFSRDDNFEGIIFESKLTPAENGAYLRGDAPADLPLPCMVRCNLYLAPGRDAEPVHFNAWQVLPVPASPLASSGPAASQPASPAASPPSATAPAGR